MEMPSSGAKLHVLVYDKTRELCRVEMPPAAADNLAHLFPDEDRALVLSAGLDLEALASAARSSGYAPQTLVDFHGPTRSYKIWLA
jgi:hypothetical protein